MPATQLGGGTFSNGLTISRASRSHQTTEKFNPISSPYRGNAGKLVALSGRKNLALGGFSLSERHRKLFNPLVTHRRKSPSNVVGNQWSSDSGAASSGVEERLAVQEEHGDLNGLRNGAP